MQIYNKIVFDGFLLLCFAGCFAGTFIYIVFFRPEWMKRFLKYDSQFYPFKYWTWEKLPENWSSVLLKFIIWMIVFSLASIYFALKKEEAVWVAIVFALMGIHFAVTTIRIIIKIIRINKNNR